MITGFRAIKIVECGEPMKVNLYSKPVIASSQLRSASAPLYEKAQLPDSFEKSAKIKSYSDYKLSKSGNTISFVSFKALQDPTILKNPSIRTGLNGIEEYQDNILSSKNLERGTELNLRVVPDENIETSEKIEISLPNGDILGFLPPSIDNAVGKFAQKNPSDFKATLYGTTNPTNKKPANVLVDLEYLGEEKPAVQEKINTLLYKNVFTPEQVLHRILDYKKVLNGEEVGTQKIQESQLAIDTITKAIADPKNQKILLIGHNKPDGDTVGSCMGLKAALDYMGKEKVDVAIDDVLAGFLRNVVDANEIKKSPEFISKLNNGISSRIRKLEHDGFTPEELQEIYSLAKVRDYYNENVQTLNPNEKYDLAIFLDVPTPTKVSPAIKQYAKSAKNIIYIDHHPFQKAEWEKEQKNGGLNIDSIKNNHMLWTESKVPANTMLVTILIDKMLPNLTSKFRDSYYKDNVSQKEKNLIEKMSSSLVVGTITDTSGYRRSINKNIEDEQLPPEKKTGFAPAGLSDWLLSLTNGEVTRRSIKKKMKFDLPNKVDFYFPQDFVDFYNTEKNSGEPQNNPLPDIEAIMQRNNDGNYKKIAEEVAKDTTVYADLGLGISKVRFDSMNEYLKKYNMKNPEINMRDVIGAYKYNPTTIALKYPSADSKYKVDPKYENDKISVMIREEEKANELNATFQMAEQNSLGFSFRSQDGTNYAGIMATLFGGGGHAAASGASLSLPGLTSDSKLIVKIDGEIETDMSKIYHIIKKNYDNNYLNKIETNSDIKLEISEEGLPIDELLCNIAKEIRQNN